MDTKPQRKRIPYQKSASNAIGDPLAFVPNKSSDNARVMFTHSESTHFETWIDKHYHERHQHGDDFGKFEGIEPETVQSLVKRATLHLLFHGARVKGFSFINNDPAEKPPTRIVLQEDVNGTMLNVVIEAHYHVVNKFEITVITAMCENDFKIQAGQYVVEVQGQGSFLRKYDNKGLTKVCEF